MLYGSLANARRGSYPKSVVALEALWMLQLASQGGFHECAEHNVSTLGVPGSVEGAGFSDSLGRNAGLSARSELAPETESAPAPLESRETGRAGGLGRPRARTRVQPSRQAVGVVGTCNSLMQQRLSAITLLGQEPA